MKRLKLKAILAAAGLTALQGFCVNPGYTKARSPYPKWIENAVIYEANVRQGTQTRDFKGLQAELPRLKRLGIDILWLMPIHPISEAERKGTLGSYYAVKDYKAVNPEFGTLQDLKDLVSAAHKLGIKVILDEVCNHTGVDNAWVTEHPDWYVHNEEGKMYGPYDWTDVYKLDYSNPELRAAMTDALLYWIKEADIDGYRCDVAGEVPTDFWEEVRPKLQEVKPVFMLAESSKPELLREAFDADYAWPMKDVFCSIAATKCINKWAREKKERRPQMTARDIRNLVLGDSEKFPDGAVHMNMVTNHDLNSWEGTEFERFGPATGAFAVLSYTLPGIPMMYTGQEVGFNHAFEFFETDSIQPDYKGNAFTAFYTGLNALKHRNTALGTHEPISNMKFYDATNPDILTFSRDNGKNRVVVVVNLGNEMADIEYVGEAPSTEGTINYFLGTEGNIPDKLAPWQYVVLTR